MNKETGIEAAVLPRKLPVQERSRARFERILEATTALIQAKGVDLVSTKEIAAAAGVSIASLYQYFPDKASIIATLADRYNEAGQACVVKAFAQVENGGDFVGAIHCMIDEYLGVFQSVPGARAIWEATQSDPRLQALDHEDCEKHAATICRAIAKVAPSISRTEALRLGRLYTIIIGSTVRAAVAMNDEDGRLFVERCKSVVLAPSIACVFEGR